MTIEAGQAIPQATFQIKTDDGVDAHESTEYFASGRTILFALPGLSPLPARQSTCRNSSQGPMTCAPPVSTASPACR